MSGGVAFVDDSARFRLFLFHFKSLFISCGEILPPKNLQSYDFQYLPSVISTHFCFCLQTFVGFDQIIPKLVSCYYTVPNESILSLKYTNFLLLQLTIHQVQWKDTLLLII